MLKRLFNRPIATPSLHAAQVQARVDDSPGWGSPNGRGQDYDPALLVELYQDALTAWRRNPIAWRIIAITTDYVVGDAITITSPLIRLDRFIHEFWNHPKNQLDLRLESMSDELGRAGDLFVLLFRNPQDGMSYIRFVTKDRIRKIETLANDWETETAYLEAAEDGGERRWLAPGHPQSEQDEAIMLHYSVNRPLGALLGESDLTTMLPWLQRYSRMLEDRVRLHWAVRAFLWMVTVPGSKIPEKVEQYRTPPEAGSIIVKDESETWQAVTPQLHGTDAEADLRAVRGMIDAGSGYPPHWRGEAADANLATATAMQAPTERHLLRRQKYFVFVLEDILYQAYQRAVLAGFQRPLAEQDYSQLFTVSVPDVSRADNEVLARAGRELAGGLQTLGALLPGHSPTWQRMVLRMYMQFSGQALAEDTLEKIMEELNR